MILVSSTHKPAGAALHFLEKSHPKKLHPQTSSRLTRLAVLWRPSSLQRQAQRPQLTGSRICVVDDVCGHADEGPDFPGRAACHRLKTNECSPVNGAKSRLSGALRVRHKAATVARCARRRRRRCASLGRFENCVLSAAVVSRSAELARTCVGAARASSPSRPPRPGAAHLEILLSLCAAPSSQKKKRQQPTCAVKVNEQRYAPKRLRAGRPPAKLVRAAVRVSKLLRERGCQA